MRKYLILLTLLSLGFSVSAAEQGNWPLDDPSPFNDTVNSNSGTAVGSITEQAAAVWQQGIDMTHDQQVNMSEPAELEFQGNLTVSLWVNLDNTDDSNEGDQGIISKDQVSSGGGREWFMAIKQPDTLRFQFRDTGDSSHLTETSFTNTNWVHVAAKWNGSGLSGGGHITLYRNGTGIAISAESGEIKDASADFRIGQFAGATGNGMAGKVDAVHVYDEALSDGEIQNLFDSNIRSNPATIDNTAKKPDPVSFGDDVGYQVNASDSDGDDLNAHAEAVYWTNGSKVKNEKMNEPSTNDFELPDWIKADLTNDGVNVTLKVDDGSTNTTASEDFYITDSGPSVSLSKPSNSTHFDYDLNWDYSTSDDGDDVPSEQLSCDLDNDTSVFATQTGSEGSLSGSGSLRKDTGFYYFNVSCTEQDGAANTAEAKNFYTVDNYRINDNFTTPQTWETINETFNVTVELGDMVNQFNSYHFYNASITSKKTYNASNNHENTTLENYDFAPVVKSNQTQFNSTFNVEINYTDFSGSTFTRENTSTTNASQEVWHGFFAKNQTHDRKKYLEFDDIKYTGYLTNKTSRPTLSSDINLNQTNETTNIPQIAAASSSIKFEGSIQTGKASSQPEAVKTSTNYTVQHEGRSRVIQPSDLTTTVHQVEINECGTGDVALEFNTKEELDRTVDVSSTVDMSIEAWNPGSFGERREFNFSSTGTSTHQFCVNPAWANLVASTFNKLIEYNADGYDKRNYYIVNESIDNSTTKTDLLLINSTTNSNAGTDTNKITYTVKNEDGDKASGIVIRVMRYFPDVDKHLTVAMMKTGGQGTDETFLEIGQVKYRHDFYEERLLVHSEGDQTITSTDITFTIGDFTPPSYLDFTENIGHSCGEINNTLFECNYSSSTNRLSKAKLLVKRKDKLDFETICDKEGSSLSGSLACSSINTSENRYRYGFTADMSGGDTIVLENGWIGNLDKPFDEIGLFVSLLLFIAISSGGWLKPEIGIIAGVASLVVSYMAGFFVIQISSLMSIVLVAAVTVWRMN